MRSLLPCVFVLALVTGCGTDDARPTSAPKTASPSSAVSTPVEPVVTSPTATTSPRSRSGHLPQGLIDLNDPSDIWGREVYRSLSRLELDLMTRNLALITAAGQVVTSTHPLDLPTDPHDDSWTLGGILDENDMASGALWDFVKGGAIKIIGSKDGSEDTEQPLTAVIRRLDGRHLIAWANPGTNLGQQDMLVEHRTRGLKAAVAAWTAQVRSPTPSP